MAGSSRSFFGLSQQSDKDRFEVCRKRCSLGDIEEVRRSDVENSIYAFQGFGQISVNEIRDFNELNRSFGILGYCILAFLEAPDGRLDPVPIVDGVFEDLSS